tara:strand:- start:59250 stop:59423 length:174 start_codon:yes stop_codon:yes gene_type:complete
MAYPSFFDLFKGKAVMNKATKMFGHVVKFGYYNKHTVFVKWADEDEPIEHEVKDISW